MERSAWVALALTVSLMAAVMLSQGYILAADSVDRLEALSSDDPPEPEWEHRMSPALAYIAGALWVASGFAVTLAWGKVRGKRIIKPKHAPTRTDEDEEDRLARPPGFGGRRIRTRRKGLAPLMGFNLLGVLLLGGAIALLVAGVLTLEQTSTMDGRGYSQAVTFGRLVLYGALPGALLGAGALGLAWGRWWPLGELEIIDEKEQARATRVKWDRQA